MKTRLSIVTCVICLSACVSTPAGRTGGITFLHLNDTYRIGAVEDGSRGGFGRVTTLIRELQREGRNVRLLHGGDFLYPSLESQLWQGEQMIEAFNYLHRLAPLTVVPGNHEFDRSGPGQLLEAMRGSEFEWLVSNVELAGTGDSAVDFSDTRVIDVGGHRIGIFGLTLTPEDGGNARSYLEYNGDYEGEARTALDALRANGADTVIGLTHLHMENDLQLADLKREYPEFRFIVGGHEHEPEHSVATSSRAEVMKGASNARVIWRIDVDFDADGDASIRSRQIDLDASVALDPDYQQLADRWRNRLLETIPFLESKIGVAAVPFDAREVVIRNEESNWGNFIADQMRGAFGETADLAFINSGTIRIDDYIAGDITFEDIARTFGFSSFLHYLQMTGAEFRQTLEAGYRGEGPSKGYFPQVSGFRVCVDRSRPEGSRIVQLQRPREGGAWGELDSEASYLVVAPEYLVGGGDGYAFPAHREPSRPGSELRYLVLDAIIAAQAQGQAVGAPVDPDNRRIAFAMPGGRCF